MQYIINTVLILQITYLTFNYIPSDKALDSLNSKIRNLWKAKCKLQKMTSSTFIYNKLISNISSIKQKIFQQVLIKLISALNSQGIYHNSMISRCQVLQNKIWSKHAIWHTNFQESISNYHEIYNKFQIVIIINIAYKLNLHVEPAQKMTSQ